uniref:Type-II membrane binding region n=1 Tax=Bacillus subtilis TaxID=1423 RepID=Q45634_BACIU|nr:type-II membrane binding region [Bacillus subtilis]
MILLWFLPLYFLLLCADDSIQDYKTGYHYILISKVGTKNIVWKK